MPYLVIPWTRLLLLMSLNVSLNAWETKVASRLTFVVMATTHNDAFVSLTTKPDRWNQEILNGRKDLHTMALFRSVENCRTFTFSILVNSAGGNLFSYSLWEGRLALRNADSLNLKKKHLKTYLFHQAFFWFINRFISNFYAHAYA